MRRTFAIIGLISAAACGPLPDVPAPEILGSEAQDYPKFVQLDSIASTTAQDDARALETEEALAARMAALKARAARLRATSVE
ncbi:MAG: hypothetical protein WBV78_14730 [Roseobacter sp.]